MIELDLRGGRTVGRRSWYIANLRWVMKTVFLVLDSVKNSNPKSLRIRLKRDQAGVMS